MIQDLLVGEVIMADAEMTLGDRWQGSFLAGMMAIHKVLRHSGLGIPKKPLVFKDMLAILQELATRSYDPAKYFVGGAAVVQALARSAPSVDEAKNYQLISLNALTIAGSRVSLTTGGLVFEDPFWAITAAYGASLAEGDKRCLPKAKDNKDLWLRSADFCEAIVKAGFHAEEYLERIEGFISRSKEPEFELVLVSGPKLNALRGRGSQALECGGKLRFYQLFEAPPAKRDKVA